MKNISLMLLTLLLIWLWTVPAWAVVISPSAASTSQEAQAANQPGEEDAAAANQEVSADSGGVQPISPEKIEGKVNALERWAVALMAPIIHLMSKLSLILAVLLILIAVFARQLLGRAFMVIGCVILGMTIFTNVGIITDTIQYMGQWLGQ